MNFVNINKGHMITSVFLSCFLALVSCLASLCFTLVDLFGEGNTVCKGFTVTVSSSLEVDSSTPISKKSQFIRYCMSKKQKYSIKSRLLTKNFESQVGWANRPYCEFQYVRSIETEHQCFPPIVEKWQGIRDYSEWFNPCSCDF